MFNLFKKKRFPPFEFLEKSAYRNKYFLRVAAWDWADLKKQHIFVVDPNGPRLLTLDPWPELVFIAANGQMTVTEYVEYMSGKYSGSVPALLDKTILDEINTLIQYKIIMLTDEKRRPDPQFELPKSAQQG